LGRASVGSPLSSTASSTVTCRSSASAAVLARRSGARVCMRLPLAVTADRAGRALTQEASVFPAPFAPTIGHLSRPARISETTRWEIDVPVSIADVTSWSRMSEKTAPRCGGGRNWKPGSLAAGVARIPRPLARGVDPPASRFAVGLRRLRVLRAVKRAPRDTLELGDLLVELARSAPRSAPGASAASSRYFRESSSDSPWSVGWSSSWISLATRRGRRGSCETTTRRPGRSGGRSLEPLERGKVRDGSIGSS
jgi:hypothetical protein